MKGGGEVWRDGILIVRAAGRAYITLPRQRMKMNGMNVPTAMMASMK
jgi:hypothetical protein